MRLRLEQPEPELLWSLGVPVPQQPGLPWWPLVLKTLVLKQWLL